MNFEQFLNHNELNDPSKHPRAAAFEAEMQAANSLNARLFLAYDLAEDEGLSELHDLVIKRMTNDRAWARADQRIGQALTDFQHYMQGCYLDETMRPLSDSQRKILELLVAYEVLNLNFHYLRSEVEEGKQLYPDISADLLAILFPRSIFESEDE